MVPADGTYRISAAGAKGGSGGYNAASGWANQGTYQWSEDAQATNGGDASRDWGNYRGNGASYSREGLTHDNAEANALPFTQGAPGGQGVASYNVDGGFGGGYTGGAEGYDLSNSGEGGGSYNAGASQVDIGPNNGHEFIEIELIP